MKENIDTGKTPATTEETVEALEEITLIKMEREEAEKEKAEKVAIKTADKINAAGEQAKSLWQHKDEIIADMKSYFKKSGIKQVLKDMYAHENFKSWVSIFAILIYILAFTAINSFFYDMVSIGSFDWDAPKFGYSELSFGDFVLFGLMMFPIIMIGILTKNSFQNLAPESWGATMNRFANQARNDDINWEKAWLIGKIWIVFKRIFRFIAPIVMVLFSKMSSFIIIWGLIAAALVIYVDFFTWWRIGLLTMLAIIVADRIWVDITRWATKRYASNISQDGGGGITTEGGEEESD